MQGALTPITAIVKQREKGKFKQHISSENATINWGAQTCAYVYVLRIMLICTILKLYTDCTYYMYVCVASLSLTGFMVARYFSLMMDSFSSLVR